MTKMAPDARTHGSISDIGSNEGQGIELSVPEAEGLSPEQYEVIGHNNRYRLAQRPGSTVVLNYRRRLFEAKDIEPEAAARGLDSIGGLYAVEDRIREQKLSAAKKFDYRLLQAKPVVERFFAWMNEHFEDQGLLPSNPLTKALAYARDRRFGLEVYLAYPDVPIDSNHLERARRAIPCGARIGCSAGPTLALRTSGSCRA